MARRTKARTTLYATALLALCVSLPWLLSPTGCRLDTSPLHGPRARVFDHDDNDSGDEHAD